MTTMRALSDQLQVDVVQTTIYGLIVTKNTGGNTLDISAGSCYDPSSGKIITYAGTTALSAGTLGAGQWNQVYIYDNAGTSTIEVVNNANPPSTAYAGTARQGGTNSNRRWIGSFLTTGSSNIFSQDVREIAANQIEVLWIADQISLFQVLNSGTATSYTNFSLVTGMPRYVATHGYFYVSFSYVTTAADSLRWELSIDGTNSQSRYVQYFPVISKATQMVVWTVIESSTPSIYYRMVIAGSAAGPQMSVWIFGYRAAR